MISLLTDFVQELRRAGIPVSMVEAIDAMDAIGHVDLGSRAGFKAALGATMVKNARHQAAFDSVFEIYFANRRFPIDPDDRPGEERSVWTDEGQTGGGGGEMSGDELIEAMFQALAAGDEQEMRRLAKMAVDRLAGMEPGRPVGGTYYLYRTMRQLDIENLQQRLLDAVMAGDEEVLDELERRLRTEEVSEIVERMREEIQAEIRRRLVEDRGHEAVAKTLRQPLIEDVDLMHATRTDLQGIESIIEPLTRKLAARLAQRRRLARTGRLDFRKTMRASLAAGGVPIEPKFRNKRPHRPEIFLLCDISGSMATFARFTLQFTYAMSAQFSKLRSFVFVDAVDEVTDYLKPGTDFSDALVRISTEADVVWLDGHSDYGHALEQFAARFRREITPRSTVIIAGDARNNYREPRAQFLGEVAQVAQAVYWLNPEPRAYWDSGDSVMARYAMWCDEVFEVRNLRQLEEFVEKVASQPLHPGRRRFRSMGRGSMPMSHSKRETA